MSGFESLPALRLTQDAWEKLWLYVHLAEGEVGGLGRVERSGDGSFLMADCFLIGQRATDVDTEVDRAATSRFLLDFAATGADPIDLRLWWHSHARESVFWSGDDERTIDHFGGEWLVSLVANQSGRFLARFDCYQPRRETIGWLKVLPPGLPPSITGKAATRALADLTRCVHVVRRATNKLWTDADLPRRT